MKSAEIDKLFVNNNEKNQILLMIFTIQNYNR